MEAQDLKQANEISCVQCGCKGEDCQCHETAPAEDHFIGKKINDQYEIVSLIAHGGMGSVYRARHLMLGTNRAIKVIRIDRHQDEIALQRFRKEAQAVMGLSHINIVSFHEYGLLGSTPYVVMDLTEGEALDRVLEKSGALNVTEALEIFVQVAAALHHAHSKGIFHRDIKPSNIMLVDDGDEHQIVKVLDFGIAKIQSDDVQKLTSTGEIFGSPAYMSPEQGRGQNVDARSDIYSLGCVMFEALNGQAPFSGNNAIETIIKHLNDPPPKLFDNKINIVGSAPVLKDLEAVIRRCLEKDPNRRYASMAALEEDLKRISYGERLLHLQHELSMRHKMKLASRIYKYALIAFAVILPIYGVYAIYVDPSSWRNRLRSALNYPDNADKIIQEIIVDLPKDNSYQFNLARLLWSQGQIIRLKSGPEAAMLSRAISKYERALECLKQHHPTDSADQKLCSELRADCLESLCRSYLQKIALTQKDNANRKSAKRFAALAKDYAQKAVNFRQAALKTRGKTRDITVDLADALGLLAKSMRVNGDSPNEIANVLLDQERFTKIYEPKGWLMADCLENQGDNALAAGDPNSAVSSWLKAIKIEAELYESNSPEVISLQRKIREAKSIEQIQPSKQVDASKSSNTR